MHKQITNFIQYLRVGRHYAINTQQAYKRDLEKLLVFTHKKSLSQWSNLTSEHLNLFVMEMRHQDNSARTIRRNLSSIRGFLAYLVNHEQLSNSCAIHLQSPKIDQNLPNILNYDNILLMLKPRSNTWLELRDVAMIEVMYSCGLRVSELVALNVNDVDLNQGFLRVIGKGAKVRHTPVGKAAQQAISRCLFDHSNHVLFVNRKQQRVSVRAVQNMVKKRALGAGIKVNVYPHMLRHTAATHFLQSSHDLRSTQEFLGHSSIKSTQVYIHLDFLELSKVYDQCHPRAKKS
ncbi:tyrosine recombinase XerC [Candidatus Ruthia endofausta]|uniref:tyrosine recombinase XerC n=1 Tax=Candidatus Ruthia endofausta TaxID=2738852 RepID=UPI001FECE82A|nr:tyrosine recombinase XerC [Candidatus Ruthia endofausta]